MDMQKQSGKSLAEFKALENELHRALMKVCRRYLNELGIISLTGLLDIVKQEVIDLEKATKRTFRKDSSENEKIDVNESSNFFE